MNKEQIKSTSETAVRKTLRPALIASEHTISNYSIFLEHLMVGLADESIPVSLVCPPQFDVNSIILPAVEIVRYPTFKLPFIEHLNRKIVVEQLQRFEPTVLHCLCESRAEFTRQLAEYFNLPFVLTVNSLQRRVLFNRLFSALKSGAKVIVPAESIANNLKEISPDITVRIEQVNIGTFAAEKLSCFSEPFRFPSIVVAYPLDRISDFEKLFGAIKRLATEGYEFAMVIMGIGRAERQLRKLLAQMGLSQRTVCVPRLVHWRSVLAAGDIFIQPQPMNFFNPLLLEAMSVGTAVAACKGGVDDLIIDGVTATVFEQNDELGIYGCLRQLFDKREWAQQIARSAQQYLRENYSVSKMISSVMRIYSEVQK